MCWWWIPNPDSITMPDRGALTDQPATRNSKEITITLLVESVETAPHTPS